jgi:hypothetical protein
LSIDSTRSIGSTKNRERAIIFGLIGIYLLIACTWMGISFFDDSMYMFWGRTVHLGSFVHWLPDSPLYAMWFKILGKVLHDPVWRYFISWGLLVTAVGTLPYWFGIRLSWFYTLAMVSLPLFNLCDYVSLFASMFVVLGMAIVLRYKLSVSAAACMACGACFVVGFARPEYESGVFVAAGIAVVALIFDKQRGSTGLVAGKVFALLFLSLFMRYSLAHSPAWRSGVAFAQHYNLRAHEKGLLPGDPWDSDYAERVFHIDLEHTANNAVVVLSDFYRANPKLVRAQMRDNLSDYRTIRLFAAVLLLSGLPWMVSRYAGLRASSVYLFSASVPVMAAEMLIYPRPHYPMTIYPMLVLMFVQLIAEYGSLKQPPAWTILLLGAGLIWAGSIYREHHWPDFDSNVRSNIALVDCFHGVERSDGAGNGKIYNPEMLSDNDIYLGITRTWLYPQGTQMWQPLSNWQAFTEWLGQTRPSWVVAGPMMTNMYHQDPAAIGAFLQGDLGYTPHPCPAATGMTVYTLLR